MNWEPDEESQQLLNHFAAKRRAKSPRISPRTVDSDLCLLRNLVYASISLGGPSTLREVRDDPAIVIRILRGEWDRSQATLGAMHSALLRLIEETVEDNQEKAMLRGQITAGLYLRPPSGRRWDVLPVSTGGTTESFTHGPALSLNDLYAIVAGVGRGNGAWVAIRSRAIVALDCFSGVTTMEIPGLRWEQLEWIGAADSMWCALITGIVHRRHRYELGVLRDAEPQLRELEHTAKELFPENPFMFAPSSGEGHVSYLTVNVTIRSAMDAAGVPRCDDLAIKRAYAAHLKALGLPDHKIQDALGLRSIVSLEGRLRQHQQANAARVAQEFTALTTQPPVGKTANHQLRLPQEVSDG